MSCSHRSSHPWERAVALQPPEVSLDTPTAQELGTHGRGSRGRQVSARRWQLLVIQPAPRSRQRFHTGSRWKI